MRDLNGNKDFSVIKPFAFWTQHVLPLVYGDEISYMETLDKVVKLLNELIKNNNKLPEYIQQIVEEYITGGPLEEVLRSILADFILNVKYPPSGITPAKGDGTANDYEAIQGCIDYAASKGGGVVYFPFGKYLTSKLTLKPNVSLMGFGKYCTSIVLTGGETDALLSGSVTDCGIYNITLDANMSIQVNDVNVLTLTGSNIQLMNVILTDGYSLFNIEKTGDNIELNNVEFRYAVESMLRIGGTVGTLNANSIKFGKLSTINGVAAIISDSNNDVITGIVSNDILPLFAQLDGNNNMLKGVVASTNVIAGDGQNNVYDFYGKTKSETYTGNVSETVHGSKSTHIDVMSTWEVDGNSTESVDGTKSEIVTGVSSAQYNEDRTVNGKNLTETLSGKKVINAQDVVLNPTNPLTYKAPIAITTDISYVPMKDKSGMEYKVMVDNGYNWNTAKSVETTTDFANVNAKVGEIYSTSGFRTSGDEGGAFYYITSSPLTVDNSTVFNTKNNLRAVLTPRNDSLNFFQVGGLGNKSNETTLINLFIDYCSTLGVKAVFPSGHYYGFGDDATETYVYLKEGSHVIIDGVFWPTSTSHSMMTNMDGNEHPVYSGFGNIVIEGAGGFFMRGVELGDTSINSPIRLAHCENILIKDIFIEEYSVYHAMEIISVRNCLIENVKCFGAYNPPSLENITVGAFNIEAAYEQSSQAGAIPYDKTPCVNITVDKCYFGNGRTNPTAQIKCAVDFHDGHNDVTHENITISNNIMFNIQLVAILLFRIKDLNIFGNVCNGCGKSFINTRFQDMVMCFNASISNNFINNVGFLNTNPMDETATMNLYNCLDTNITGNTIVDSFAYCIMLGSCSRVSFTGNTGISLLKNNPATDSDSFAMFILKDSDELDIIGNTMSVQDTDTISTQVFTNTSTNVRVRFNIFNIKSINNWNYMSDNILATGSWGVGDTITFSSTQKKFDATVYIMQVVGIGYACVTLDNTFGLSNGIILSGNIAGDEPVLFTVKINFVNNTSITITDSIKTTLTTTGYTTVKGTTNDDSPIKVVSVIGINKSNYVGIR